MVESGGVNAQVMPQATATPSPPPSSSSSSASSSSDPPKHGQDLFDYVDAHPSGLAPAEIRSVLKQLCDAVFFLHEHSIVHRDIKDEVRSLFSFLAFLLLRAPPSLSLCLSLRESSVDSSRAGTRIDVVVKGMGTDKVTLPSSLAERRPRRRRNRPSHRLWQRRLRQRRSQVRYLLWNARVRPPLPPLLLAIGRETDDARFLLAVSPLPRC